MPEISLETGNSYGLVRTERTNERPVLLLRNPTLSPMQWTGDVMFEDGFGRSFPVAVPTRLVEGEVREIPLPWPLPAKGVWVCRAVLTATNGWVATNELRFAYVDLHEMTPFAFRPKFRFGMNIDSAEDLEAVVAAGFKLVRATAYTTMIESQGAGEGRYDWSGADGMIGKLNDAGIAIDAIVYSTPQWAIDEKVLEERKDLPGFPWLMPTRPGLFERHCRAVAERFAGKIDYYEVGNEFDIRDPNIRTHEEATRMQREAFEGVHAADPKGCVIPGGFAGAAPIKEYPFAAEVMENYVAHAENYDAWAFHCHGPFPDYVRSLEAQFLPFRESTALKEKPWIPNETALSCYRRSETEVARTVWAKSLYAWSKGAMDYIWYNLVAIGPQDDNETGYGILTHDRKPRAAYAAFSALTRIFQGLDFDGAVYSRKLRHLLRFRGRSEGADGIVLAGWDWQAKAARSVRIRTDARQAFVSDCMGNLSERDVVAGEVRFDIDENPKALILTGATRAEAADPAELEDAPPEAQIIPLPQKDRAPDFRLDDARFVRELHPSAVATAHRVWSGPGDQSASVWLERDGDRIKVHVDVEDDVDAEGDGAVVQLHVFGRALVEFGPKPSDACSVLKRREGTKTSWSLTIDGTKCGISAADLFKGIGFGVRILEDDGEGLDGWMQLTSEIEDLRQVRFAFVSDGTTGGLRSFWGDSCIHTFCENGTFTVERDILADVLLVGGGGGGGFNYGSSNPGGGGGAGGFVYKRNVVISAGSYSIVIGEGGAAAADGNAAAADGGATEAFGFVAPGGGGGANCLAWKGARSGASGGGGTHNWDDDYTKLAGFGSAAAEGAFGHAGGGSYTAVAAGGGGGAGAPGGIGGYPTDDGHNGVSGSGGVGLPCAITGEEVWYAGGGAGGRGQRGVEGIVGGRGGGGNPNQPGVDGLGGGGGGGAKGGSGVVIISHIRPTVVPSADFDVTGGDEVIKLGDDQVRIFRQSGTMSVSGNGAVEMLLVGGGGGGGIGYANAHCGGGGGAGGVVHCHSVPVMAGEYPIVVGAGGAGCANGEDSSVDLLGLTAHGGGAGGSYFAVGESGGSGGGSGAHPNNGDYSYALSGGVSVSGQGHAGGGSYTKRGAGGGGGAGACGLTAGVRDGTGDSISANGGDGIQCAITGADVWYAGGGAGGGTVMSVGGKGGGGKNEVAGTDGLGGGGGGSGTENCAPGGSGVVIVRFSRERNSDVSPSRKTDVQLQFRDGHRIRTFLTNGTFTLARDIRADVLLVGGGGGGGFNYGSSNPGGGGGAGGFVYRRNVVIPAGSHSIVVGEGGGAAADGNAAAADGGATEAFGFVAPGGGGGANCLTWKSARSGASGGGGTHNWDDDYTKITGFGMAMDEGDALGHAGGGSYTAVAAGGGGGAGGSGGIGGYPTDDGHNGVSGSGGVGLPCAITGEEVWYAGGGAGGRGLRGIEGVVGGRGGGGDPNQPGVDGLGGGGGGGAKGGSGVVIISSEAVPKGGVLIIR